MPVPFGVGVGDFLAVLNAVRTIFNALSDTHGARSQVRALQTVIDGLKEAIKDLDSIECDHEVLAVNLSKATKDLEGTISNFGRKIKKYSCFFESAQSRGGLVDAVRKVQWALFSKGGVLEFRAEVLAHATNIQMFLHRLT
jgi:hypothetical protein